MTRESSSTSGRKYVAPRTTTYDEARVAEELGPVMLSGTGARLGELSGNDSPTSHGGDSKPRR
jgi:hypothetical protein